MDDDSDDYSEINLEIENDDIDGISIRISIVIHHRVRNSFLMKYRPCTAKCAATMVKQCNIFFVSADDSNSEGNSEIILGVGNHCSEGINL